MKDTLEKMQEAKRKSRRQRDNWKRRAELLHSAIQEFCKQQKWADSGWKGQPHIKALFDLAEMGLVEVDPKDAIKRIAPGWTYEEVE